MSGGQNAELCIVKAGALYSDIYDLDLYINGSLLRISGSPTFSLVLQHCITEQEFRAEPIKPTALLHRSLDLLNYYNYYNCLILTYFPYFKKYM
jgi:hypothetical protein